MKSLLAILLFSFGAQAQQNLQDFIATPPKGVHTDVLIVIKDSKTLFEHYDRGFKSETPHLSWSMAKTFTGILLAQASMEYGFSLEDKVQKFIPEFKGEARIIDLIQMSSGIDFSEEYYGIPVNSDVVRMLYLDGEKNGASGYVKSLPLYQDHKPGTYFYYSSGDSNLLMEILKRVINDNQKYDNYPWEKLFNPLEIKNVTFEQDSQNVFIGSSYIYMSAADYLKVARLIMQKGQWNNKQIIPKFYFKLMTELAPGVSQLALDGTSTTRAYSAQTTTNLPIPERKLSSEFPDMPLDTLFLYGHQGQIIAVSPSEKMILLRLGFDKGSALDKQLLYKLTKDEIKKTFNSYKTVGDEKPQFEGNKKTELKLRLNKGFSISDLVKVPQLIRSYTAKEFCSCYFITGRSEDWCRKDIGYTMPVMPKIVIQDDKSITTSFWFGTKVTAKFRNEKLGCYLTTSEK